MVTRTTILSAIMSFGFLVAPAIAAPAISAAAAGEYVGGIDIQGFCNREYGNEWRALRYDNSCNGWKCWWAEFDIALGVDTPKACAYQYGSGVYAWCTGGVDSWGCFRS